MKDLLDKLIAEAPPENEGAAPLQLQIRGQVYAGGLRKSQDHEGCYELLTVGQQGRNALAVSVVFKADAVDIVFIPKGEMSDIVQPRKNGSGIILPGAS